jgi:hypothetical protein
MSVVIRRSPDMSFSPRLLILAVLITLMSVVGATTLAPHHDPLLLPVNSSVPAVTSTISAGDTAWLLTSGALVSLMTPGLAFFYGGLVESTTVLNTLMMSYVCAAIVTVRFCIFCSEKSLSTILFIFVAFTDPISGVWLFTRVQRAELILRRWSGCCDEEFESRRCFKFVAESKCTTCCVHLFRAAIRVRFILNHHFLPLSVFF